MNPIRLLHRDAMDFMDKAVASQKDGDFETSDKLRQKALDLESEAAETLFASEDAEPTRSILYRSAASIALQCGLHARAERLIYRALAGTPPDAIAEELRDLLEDASFRRHLVLKGIQLSNTEVQVAIEGRGIGYGIAPTAEVVPRIEGTNILLYRTAERIASQSYRETGPPTNDIRNVAQSFVSLPRAASYAFTIRVGRSQQTLFEDPSEGVVDELLDCLALLDSGNQDALKERIVDPAYYNNFVALAQTILPDGSEVKTVGFTVQRNGETREVALRQTATEIRNSFRPLLSSKTQRVTRGVEKAVEVSGRLRLADALHEANKIQLASGGRSITVHVPEGMMTDIVKPLWDEWVTIEGIKMGRSIMLTNIRRQITQPSNE
jgi:hypothetical protein